MAKKDLREEMSLEEAKAYRASLYKEPVKKLSEKEKREQFRIFWATEKKKYGKKKELEPIIWLHLKSAGFADPEKFKDGLVHFGLKKVN